jgi:hypothetical protein
MGRKTDIAAGGHEIAQAGFSGAPYEREIQMIKTTCRANARCFQ